jgi:2-polyprenyl-3-methyl-5-hydroxy-6-metoxy-1,4-benzoquinol methylase
MTCCRTVMADFSQYFDQRMDALLQCTGFPKFYVKARRRYKASFALAYPALSQGGKAVLDLGGWEMAFLCAPLAASVVAVSLGAPKLPADERCRIQAQTFSVLDAAFPLEGRQFDIVFFLEILEHLPPPTDLVMKRLRSVLRPDGILVMSVPNLAFWQKRLKFFLFGRSPLKLGDERDIYGGYHHIRTYTYDECLTLLNRYGFRVIRCISGNYQRDFRSGWYNYPFHLMERVFTRFAHKLIFLAAPR